MSYVKKYALLSSIVVLSAACGGGGGDGRDATDVSGLWTGALTKVSDSCTPQSPSTINISHNVAQNEDAVTLLAESGVQFVGNTVGENGFSVDGSHATVGNGSCTDTTRIEYDSINNDADTTADVDITISRSCLGASTCAIAYTGTVSRTGGSAVTPTPAPGTPPTSTTTPIAGGCPAMNPNPASGTYSGDGGCGISDTDFNYASNTVVLEPFGANGATSFSVNTANPSEASSVRTDLTIQGVPGYACTMACSAPGTFSIQCFKEGGTSCVEKF